MRGSVFGVGVQSSMLQKDLSAGFHVPRFEDRGVEVQSLKHAQELDFGLQLPTHASRSSSGIHPYSLGFWV